MKNGLLSRLWGFKQSFPRIRAKILKKWQVFDY
jgi:hypothetical protein